jgi:hypothetical protein
LTIDSDLDNIKSTRDEPAKPIVAFINYCVYIQFYWQENCAIPKKL